MIELLEGSSLADRFQLHGGWKITGYGQNGEIVGPIEGTVPGHVHTDLLRHGLIPDPLWRDQAIQTQWIESFDWVYETEFEWRDESRVDDATIRFEGLDTIATIHVNDSEIGSAANMFIPHEFPLRHAIVVGTNRLTVRFTSIQKHLRDKDVGKYVSLFSQDRVFLRRMQCTFGWDWVHRLVSYGIWRPVFIEAKPDGRINNAFMRTVGLGDGEARVAWEVKLEGANADSRIHAQLIDPAGQVVWEQQAACGDGSASGEFALRNPRLWWPSGYGEAALYRFEVRLVAADGHPCDSCSEEIGIRTVEVEQLPDDQGSSYTIVVNGLRIFAKGGNWVPADPFPSRVTEERYEQLLQLLVDGNMNMLRVWGGGTYELPAFWQACNRLGIMVSLDFMMACAQYPEHEQWFVEAMKTEVTASVQSLRNHPSLVFWCGDNELAMNNNPEDEYWGKTICAQVTEPTVKALDPSRPYFATSPIGGRPFNSQDEGDCHFSTWYDPVFILGDMKDYRERIMEGRGRFLSECVVFGAPPLASLLKMMTADDAVDPSAAMWEFRTKDNPYNGQDELTHHRMLEKTAITLFGASDDPLQKIRKMEYVQYEFARLQAEHYRRRKYDTSGLLFWMFGDCWPASGCAMVDYFGMPKAGYFGAKKAFTPVMISLESRNDKLGVWIANDTLDELQGAIEVRAATTDGRQLAARQWHGGQVPANASVMIGEIDKAELGLNSDAADVVVQASWQASVEEGLSGSGDRTIYFEVLPKHLRLHPAKLRINHMPYDERSGVIEIAADAFARVVTIDGDLHVDDNYFDMMPGEVRVVKYAAGSSAPLQGPPQVSCWNLG